MMQRNPSGSLATGHVCYLCEGRKYVLCRTCSGKRAIDWQPIAGAAIHRVCVCPTCGGKTAWRHNFFVQLNFSLTQASLSHEVR